MYMLKIMRPNTRTQAGCFDSREDCLRALITIHDVCEAGTRAEIVDPDGNIVDMFHKDSPSTLH